MKLTPAITALQREQQEQQTENKGPFHEQKICGKLKTGSVSWCSEGRAQFMTEEEPSQLHPQGPA